MIERAWVGGVLTVIAGLVLPAGAGAAEPVEKPAAPIILNLINRPMESRDRAFSEEIKRDALAPRPSAIDEWEPQPDGSMRNRRNFAPIQYGKASGADGMAVDNEGRLYLSARLKDGVQVFSPEGRHLGTIPLSRAPQNLAFAGPDKKTLYVVGRGSAFKVDLMTPGFKGRGK